MSKIDRIARLLTARDLFVVIDNMPFHLWHFVEGLGRKVWVGSDHPVGLSTLPPSVGFFQLGSIRWFFTPVSHPAIIHDREVSKNIKESIRHGTIIGIAGHEMIFKIASNKERERYERFCCVCGPAA